MELLDYPTEEVWKEINAFVEQAKAEKKNYGYALFTFSKPFVLRLDNSTIERPFKEEGDSYGGSWGNGGLIYCAEQFDADVNDYNNSVGEGTKASYNVFKVFLTQKAKEELEKMRKFRTFIPDEDLIPEKDINKATEEELKEQLERYKSKITDYFYNDRDLDFDKDYNSNYKNFTYWIRKILEKLNQNTSIEEIEKEARAIAIQSRIEYCKSQIKGNTPSKIQDAKRYYSWALEYQLKGDTEYYKTWFKHSFDDFKDYLKMCAIAGEQPKYSWKDVTDAVKIVEVKQVKVEYDV